METSELSSLYINLLLVLIGTLLGVKVNKLVTSKLQTKWKWASYILGGISIIAAPLYLWVSNNNGFSFYFIPCLFVVCGVLLISFTSSCLDVKTIFKSNELDPIINNFTSSADHKGINLFGGDLSFFGNTPSEIDQNSQYKHLLNSNFNNIFILCEVPGNTKCMIRYGKILSEMNGVKLKFYNPEDADLKIRGRMKTFQGVEKLLIYSKIGSGIYQTIETDTANSNGALYNNIWKLIWSLAKEISEDQVQEYVGLFKTHTHSVMSN